MAWPIESTKTKPLYKTMFKSNYPKKSWYTMAKLEYEKISFLKILYFKIGWENANKYIFLS